MAHHMPSSHSSKKVQLVGGWKPDEVIPHPDGSREEIRYRRRPGADGNYSRTRKIIGKDGQTLEVIHEVVDSEGSLVRSEGSVLHQHRLFPAEEDGR